MVPATYVVDVKMISGVDAMNVFLCTRGSRVQRSLLLIRSVYRELRLR